MSKVTNTIDYLIRCQAHANGIAVAYTTDPSWLVNEAINRRAGWLEDRHTRGTMRPIDGRLPRKAGGDRQRHLRQLAWRINTPRLVVRETELGEHHWLLTRIPHRITRRGED